MAPVELVEASLRHGQQSLLVSRLRQRHAVPVARLLDRCGFAALDVFGGTTFEASLRFLAENPFDRLRAIREAAPETPLLASIAGRSLVGHRRVADDVIDAFVRVTAAAGIDIFRCHDPLNDVRNLERCVQAVHAAGKIAEGVICYTDGSVDALVEVARRLAAAGFDRLCLHDPLGLPGGARTREITRRVLEVTSMPLGISLSAQTGQAGLAYWSAAEAGAVRLDVALSPLAGGASLPPAEAIIAATMDTELRTGLDVRQVAAASDALDSFMPLYQEIIDPAVWRYDHSALRGLLPASAMPHAMRELRDRDRLDLFDDVEQEITRVRSELGYPPLVSPIIEIIATQAVYNVCDGDRYASISQEVSDYCLGLYGEPPEPIDPLVREVVTIRALDIELPTMAEARLGLERAGVADPSEEAVVCYALFPAEYVALVAGTAVEERLPEAAADAPAPEREPEPEGVSEPVPEGGVQSFTIEVDGQPYAVRVSGGGGGGGVGGGGTAAVPRAAGGAVAGVLVAPMPGVVVSIAVATGEVVAAGDVVAVLEAMKMQNEIVAPAAGTVREVMVAAGATVAPGDPLVRID